MGIIYIFLIIEIVAFSLVDKTKYYAKKYLPLIIMLSLGVIMGIRYNVGIDYPTYEDVFNNPYSWNRGGIEPLWLFFIDSLRNLSFKSRIFFFITSFIYVYGYYVGFKRLSPQIYLSFLLFIVIDTYGEGSNTIRQTCAQAVLFAGSNYFLEKKWKKFLPYALGAVLLHLSAFMGLAIMFICRIRFKHWLLYALVLISFAIGPAIMNRLLSVLMAAVVVIGKYNYTPESFDPGVATGTLRILYTLTGILILGLTQSINYKNLPTWIYILVNLVVVGVLIYNIFYLFLPVNRLNRYCFPYLTVLLPILCTRIKRPSRYILEGGISFGFLLFLLKTALSHPYNFDFYFI